MVLKNYLEKVSLICLATFLIAFLISIALLIPKLEEAPRQDAIGRPDMKSIKLTVTIVSSSYMSTAYLQRRSLLCCCCESSGIRQSLTSCNPEPSTASKSCISYSISLAGIWYVSLFIIDTYSYLDKFVFCETVDLEVVQPESVHNKTMIMEYDIEARIISK